METDIFGFSDSLEETKTLNNSTDSIGLSNDACTSCAEFTHPLTSPQVLGSVSNDTSGNSTVHTYRKQSVLDPLFPAMELS